MKISKPWNKMVKWVSFAIAALVAIGAVVIFFIERGKNPGNLLNLIWLAVALVAISAAAFFFTRNEAEEEEEINDEVERELLSLKRKKDSLRQKAMEARISASRLKLSYDKINLNIAELEAQQAAEKADVKAWLG